MKEIDDNSKHNSSSLIGLLLKPFELIDEFMDSIPIIGDYWNHVIHGKPLDYYDKKD